MTNRENKRIKKVRTALVKAFGGKCEDCGTTENLEFCHIEETGLNGASRGRKERYYDVIHNPLSYRLKCKDCHVIYDAKGRSACQ